MKRSAAKGFEDDCDAEIVAAPTKDDDNNVSVRFPDGKVCETQDEAIVYANGPVPEGFTVK